MKLNNLFQIMFYPHSFIDKLIVSLREKWPNTKLFLDLIFPHLD